MLYIDLHPRRKINSKSKNSSTLSDLLIITVVNRYNSNVKRNFKEMSLEKIELPQLITRVIHVVI